MELYNKYMNNEISIEEYIKSKSYETYELPTSKCDALIRKIKNDIKAVNKDETINISLEITDKDVYLLHLTEDYKLKSKLQITLKEVLEKEKTKIFGKIYYLLGKGIDGDKYYLQKATFNCDWYWGGGYIDTFNRTKTDISTHTHYDSGDINGYKFANYDAFNKAFEITTLTEKETWRFHELMRTFYTARKAMDMSHRGSSHITNNPLTELIKNDDVYTHFDNVIQAINDELDKLLSPTE